MIDKLPGHKARKRFGQNFLSDPYWIGKIADAIGARPEEAIVEIGPGQAALTRELIDSAKHISCVEIDRDLAAWLRTKFLENELTLIEADALKVDWRALAEEQKLRVVGNLPYNISSPLLFRLTEIWDRVVDQHFMLQKEVVDRMCAQPGTKDYGRLSVMLQSHYKMIKLFDVPPTAFSPAPKVTSSVVRMVPLERTLEVDANVFSATVATAFSMRRKTLRNALAKLLTAEQIASVNVRPEARAETLDVAAFVRLSNLISSLGIAQN